MQHLPTQMDRVIEALRILPPEPIDAKILAELIDLSPKQAGRCLSVLHCTNHIAKIGITNEGYALYIRTRKPLGIKSSSVRRAYKVRLQRSRTTIEKRIAKIEVVVREIQKELKQQGPLSTLGNPAQQLTLFR